MLFYFDIMKTVEESIMKDLISIIVPVWNVEKYLSKCLDSILAQTYSNYEIVIVNDGSPDNSQTIINKYAKKYPKKIRAFIKTNGGLSDARNFGIKKAKGEYLIFVDSDDTIESTMVEKMYDFAKENDYDIVACGTKLVFDDGGHKEIRARFYLNDINYLDYIISVPTACNKIYKRHLFDKNYQFKKGIFYEDLELIPSFVIKTSKIGYIEKSFYNYYQRTGSIMLQPVFNNKLLDIFTSLDSLTNRFKLNNVYDEYYEEIEYLYIEHLLYSAALRFSMYKEGAKYINKINEIINNKYKNWHKNKYYQRKSLIFKVVCHLTRLRCSIILRKLNRIKNKKGRIT